MRPTPLPKLTASIGTFHRQDVLCIRKPAQGLQGGEAGLFWDQTVGVELLRRANAYPKLVEAMREISSWTNAATLRKVGEPDNFGGEARESNRIARAILRELGEDV